MIYYHDSFLPTYPKYSTFNTICASSFILLRLVDLVDLDMSYVRAEAVKVRTVFLRVRVCVCV